MDSLLKKQCDEVIFKKLCSSSDYLLTEGVLTYVSTDIEVDTLKLIKRALCDNKSVAIPRCLEGNDMEFCVIGCLDDLQDGKFGIKEPKKYCQKVTDFSDYICITPCLTVDKNLFRLGYGKGFYDKFFSKYQVLKVGICYSFCLVDELPVNSFDKRLDVLITD